MKLYFFIEKRRNRLKPEFYGIYYLLGSAEEQETALVKRFIEVPVYFFLCFICKVDKHVPAYDKITGRRIRIL